MFTKKENAKGYHNETRRLQPSANRTRLISTFSDIVNLSASYQQVDVEPQSSSRNMSTPMVAWNFSNLIQGIGIMAIPYAVREAGVLTLFVIIPMIGFLSCLTSKYLLDCMYGIKRRRTIHDKRLANSYVNLAQKVWPQYGRSILLGFTVTEMGGAVVMYLILAAETSQSMINFWFNLTLPLRFYSLIIWMLAIAMVLAIHRLETIACLSFIGICNLLAALLAIFLHCCWSMKSPHMETLLQLPEHPLRGISISIGIVTFSCCGHAIFPNVEANMRHPHHYNAMANCCFLSSTLFKMLFGAAITVVTNRTSSEIPEDATDMLKDDVIMYQLTSLFVFTNVVCTVPLLVSIINANINVILLPKLQQKYSQPGRLPNYLWNCLIRSTIVTMALFCSILIPHFSLFVGFIGSLAGSFLTYIFPTYFYAQLCANKDYTDCDNPTTKQKRRTKLIMYGIVVIGLLSAVFGAVHSGEQIFKS